MTSFLLRVMEVRKSEEKWEAAEHWDSDTTSVQAAGVSLAGRALEQRSRPVNQGTGLFGLGLSPTTVAELGT